MECARINGRGVCSKYVGGVLTDGAQASCGHIHVESA